MKYKYFISDLSDPYINLAVERSLFEFADNNTAILYLWQNDNTIVLGRNQDVDSECKAKEFRAQCGKVARRMSGGGAVYHDLGNLNFSIITLATDNYRRRYIEIVLHAAKLLGINAEFSGRNDIIYKGRKFSGNAVYSSKEKMCCHGTVLVDTDIGKMTYFLTPRNEKLKRHGVESVRSRVINLREIDSAITIESVKNSFIEGTEAEPLNGVPADEKVKEYTELFGSKKWIYGGQK